MIEADETSIYLQNAFNMHNRNSSNAGGNKGMMSALEALAEIESACDELLNTCSEQQTQVDATASRLGDQHSILSLASRRTGVSDLSAGTGNAVVASTPSFTNTIYSSNRYSTDSIFNTTTNNSIDIDLGQVIDAYLTRTLNNSDRKIHVAHSTLEGYSMTAKNLLYSGSGEQDFVNHALHQIQVMDSRIEGLDRHSEEKIKAQKDRCVDDGMSESQLHARINSLFNYAMKSNDNAKQSDLVKEPWWKESMSKEFQRSAANPLEGPSPFVAKNGARRESLGNDSKSSGKHVTFI